MKTYLELLFVVLMSTLGSSIKISLVKKTIDSRGQAKYLQVPFIVRTPGLISGCNDTLEKSNVN